MPSIRRVTTAVISALALTITCGARLLDPAWAAWRAGIIAEWSFRSSTCSSVVCWAA